MAAEELAVSEVVCPTLPHVPVHRGAGSLVLPGGEGGRGHSHGVSLQLEGVFHFVCAGAQPFSRDISSSPATSLWERF